MSKMDGVLRTMVEEENKSKVTYPAIEFTPEGKELRVVQAYYFLNGKTEKGEFKLKRLTTSETAVFLTQSQRKNPRTGQVIDNDDVKYIKLYLAGSIYDCTILVGGVTPWKDSTDFMTKVKIIENLDEDMFVYLVNETKNMRRDMGTKPVEDFQQTPSDTS